ncbi:hypothetical protein LTR78_009679 [Recurvomyces mirabilis]|uniref:Uncharacterized protein n=1 Tax=Recurvomyces mirabilis TaxID=574656 RepID=A0AAE0TNA4_9PEZI|nr:hypothetical protein LTR78_009679 [Recurvomyces mirabilis]KAK5150280.1 hypothetical protein LTS14_010256 [Recurvomyces mirabilis]
MNAFAQSDISRGIGIGNAAPTDETAKRWPSRISYATQAQRTKRDARIKQYRDYIEERNNCKNEIDRVVANIYTMLPPELVLVLFDHLVRACEWPLRGQDPRAVLGPPSIQMPTEQSLENAIESVFAMLPFVREFSDTPAPGFTVKSGLSSKFFSSAAKKALLTQHALSFPAIYPSATEPATRPYPPFLADKRDLIRHLNLLIDLDTIHYPLPLYLAQDSIHRLKEWFPQARSVVIKIIVSSYDRAYHKRGKANEVTNIGDEGRKLVKELQKVRVKKMYLMINTVGHGTGSMLEKGSIWADQVVPSSDPEVWFKLLRGAIVEVVEGGIAT